MPIDWGSGFSPPASGGLLGANPYQYLGDLGFGLLAASGPSLQPQGGLGARIGRAGMYANERQDQGLLNEARRQGIASTAREQQGLQDIQKWATENPNATEDQFAAAATRYMPELAIKARLGSYLDPKDRLQMAQIAATSQLTQAQLAKLQQEQEDVKAQAVTEPTQTLGNIGAIADASERLDKANSIFQPGGLIEKFGGLDVAAGGLMAAELAGIGGETTKQLVNQVTDAQNVNKATAALAQSLQGAVGSSSRSAYALRNIQTALGQNMIWPAKRRILLENLQVVFTDAEAQGLDKKIPNYAASKELYDRLKAQDDAFTKRNEPQQDTAAPAGAPAAPPQAAAPGGVPGFSMFPQAGAAPPAAGLGIPPVSPAPAAAAPPAAMPPVDQLKRYPRKADGQRAAGPGGYFIAPDDKGVLSVWQNP